MNTTTIIMISSSTTSSAPPPTVTVKHFCDLAAFTRKYEEIHGPLSLLVCVFGSVANLLNICVLTTKEMRWPTNLILTGLAVADLLVMLDYIPFSIHRYIDSESRKYVDNYTYNWAVFTIFHALFSQVFHFISCCLTVLLAIWRYMTITSNTSSARLFFSNIQKTFYVIVATYIICPLICLPFFVSLKIQQHNQTCEQDGKMLDRIQLENYTGQIYTKLIYYVDISDYKYVTFWIYGVVIKLVPCILLTHLSWRLISILLERKRKRKLLLTGNLALKQHNGTGARNHAAADDDDSNAIKPILAKKNDRQADRTSGMLLAVLLLFLITEFPQAILGLLSAILGVQFEQQCYNPLGDLMDILALTNSAINFILYCTMSRQFRQSFCKIFQPTKCFPPSSKQQFETTHAETKFTQV